MFRKCFCIRKSACMSGLMHKNGALQLAVVYLCLYGLQERKTGVFLYWHLVLRENGSWCHPLFHRLCHHCASSQSVRLHVTYLSIFL